MNFFRVFKRTAKASVHINGKDYVGHNISINSSGVVIDGVLQDGKLVAPIHIAVVGDVDELHTGSGDVQVTGAVGNVETGSGNVRCADVQGNVSTASGNVKASLIHGKVKTMSGNVTHR